MRIVVEIVDTGIIALAEYPQVFDRLLVSM
jgi:hypothetical protein